MCSPVIPTCPIIAGATPQSVVSSGFDAVASSFEQGLGQMMHTPSTCSLHGPSPDVSTASGSVLARLDGLTAPLVAFAAIIGLLAGGVRLAWAGHGRRRSGLGREAVGVRPQRTHHPRIQHLDHDALLFSMESKRRLEHRSMPTSPTRTLGPTTHAALAGRACSALLMDDAVESLTGL